MSSWMSKLAGELFWSVFFLCCNNLCTMSYFLLFKTWKLNLFGSLRWYVRVKCIQLSLNWIEIVSTRNFLGLWSIYNLFCMYMNGITWFWRWNYLLPIPESYSNSLAQLRFFPIMYYLNITTQSFLCNVNIRFFFCAILFRLL